MKRRAEHEVYELAISEWPNGRTHVGHLTFSDRHAEDWEAAGGRVNRLVNAQHQPEGQSAETLRRDGTFALLLGLERHKRRRGAAPKRLTKAEARELLRSSPGPRAEPEELAKWFALVGASEDGEP